MTSTDHDETIYALRVQLIAAADENTLMALSLDSIEVALVVIGNMGGAVVPDEWVHRLWARLIEGEDIGGGEEESLILQMLRPYQPPEEWEDQDDRSAVLRFAASVVHPALDVSLSWRERADSSAYVLADLHSHVDLASDQWSEEAVKRDLRPAVLGSGVSYDGFCMRRQNTLLEMLNGGIGISASSVREVTDHGKEYLHRALVSLVGAGML